MKSFPPLSNFKRFKAHRFGFLLLALLSLVLLPVLRAQPVISSPTNALGTVGSPFSYLISASGNPTNYTLSNAAPGLSLSNGTAIATNAGLVTWRSTNPAIVGLPQKSGLFTNTVSASFTNGTATNNVVLLVNPPAAPVLASPLTFFGMVGEPFVYPLLSVPSHSNVPTAFGAPNLPLGLSNTNKTNANAAYPYLTVTNYSVEGVPALGSEGSYAVSVEITNNLGATLQASTNPVVFVIAPSAAPTITSAGAVNATVGVPFSFDITAANSPNLFRVRTAGLPPGPWKTNGVVPGGLSISNLALGSYKVGRLSGVPATTNTITLDVEASNSAGPSATVQLTITVAPPQPTVILSQPLGEANYVVGSSFFVNAQAFDRLPDNIVPSSVGFQEVPGAGPPTPIPGIVGRLGDFYGLEYYPAAATGVSFDVQATARNSLGQPAASGPLAMTARTPQSALPTVEMLPLFPGPQIQAGSRVTLRARAIAPGRPVQRVEFYVNKVFIDAVTAPVPGTPGQYEVEWTTPGQPGSFEINARVVSENIPAGALELGSPPHFASVITRVPLIVNTINALPPSVAIVSPASGAQLGFGVPNRITAAASVASGSISEVQFYQNGRPIGAPVTTAPFAVDFTPTSYGSYELFAIATSSAGLSSVSPPVTVTAVQGAAPSVTLTEPADATTSINVGQPVTLAATASDSDGSISQVDFVVNGLVVNTDATAPYRFDFAPGAPGRYEVVARATDNLGNVTDSTAKVLFASVGTAPTIEITAPVASATPPPVYGMKINEAVTIRALPKITQLGTNVQKVDFVFNGVVIATQGPLAAGTSYNFPWRADNTGRYSVVARVTDNLGNVADSRPIEINVTQGTAPTVSITSPVLADVLTPGVPVSIVADIAGKSGTVALAEFFVNGMNIGNTTAEPYLVLFTPPAAGPYEIMVRATDSLGNVTDSARRTVNADKPVGLQPLVLLSQPLAGSRFVAGSTIYLNATATKGDGTIDAGMTLRFLVNGIEQAGVSRDSATGQFSVPFNFSQAGATYSVQAVATQSGGVQGTAAPVNVATLGAQNPFPQVEILDLLPGTATTAGGIIPLRAEVQLFGADPEQTLVQFYGDGFYLGNGTLQTDGTYLFNWRTPKVARAYSTVRARVVAPNATVTIGGGGGGEQQEIVYFASVFSSNFLTLNTASGVPPQVSLIQPTDGSTATLGQQLTLRASASGSPGVTSITVSNRGAGYTTAPTVTIAAPPAGGTQAVAVAVLGTGANAGQVVSVTVTDAGSGYTSMPAVTFAAPPVGGTRATGAAVLRTPTVASVQFLVNGEPIPEALDTTAPYEAVYTPQSQGSYILSAVARSTEGLLSVADSVVVNVQSGSAPTVTITNPTVAAGVSVNYVPGTTIPLAASAQPVTAGARIASMQFFVNGVSLGLPDTEAPYEQPFTIPGAGPYSIVAVATDSFGNTGSSSVQINSAIPAGGAPFVQIDYPTPNPLTMPPGSEIFVNARAVIPSGRTVQEIRFYLDGIRVQTVASSLEASYRYRQSDADDHVIYAEIVDSANNAFFSAPLLVDAERVLTFPVPSIALSPIQGPAGGVTVGSSVFLVAEANAGLQSVELVDFYANGIYIGSTGNSGVPGIGRFRAIFEWQPSVAGNYQLTAALRGVQSFPSKDSYSVISNPQSLFVTAPSAPPSISFLSPANNSIFAPNTQVVVTADATATSPRRIARVAFFVNGEPALEDTSAPFSLPINLSTPGAYLVTAVATDSSNQTASAQITLNAKAPTGGEPAVAVTQPLGESRFVFGSELFLNMTASDRGGSIKVGSTQFYLNGEGRAATFAFNSQYSASYISSTTTPVLEISAVAEDNSGNVTVSRGPRLDFVQATRPLPLGVEVLPLPANTATPVGGLIPLRATALFPANAAEEKRVDFFVDGVFVGTGTETAAGSNVYTYNWRAPSQPPTGKSYEVQARALALNTTVTVGEDEIKYYSSVVSSNPAPFIITTGTAIPPIVRVTSPLGGSTIPVGREVSILADASATGSTIAAVEFFVNGRSVGTSTQAPYSVRFTPPSKGVYNISVVAETVSGLQGVSPTVSAIVVDANPAEVPVVTILSPRAGQTFPPGSNVTVLAKAVSPSFTIDSVFFYVNEVLQGTSTVANSSGDYSQLLSLPSQGNYFLKVVAADRFGNTGFAESVITSRAGSGAAPVVRLTVPARDTDYVLGSEIYLNATATDADGTVTSVKFFANNVEIKDPLVRRVGDSYSLRWRIPAADQTFVLHATGTDNRGNSTSSDPVTVQTAQLLNPLPTLTMLAPLAPSAAGQPLTLRARAEFPPAAAGESTVQFYANGVLVGTGQATAGSNVYTYGWTPPAGVAFDDLGAVASAVNYTAGRTYLGARLAQSTVGKDQPVINSPPTWTAAVGLANTYRITASNGPLVSFTARQENGQPLPIWMTFDAATGIVTATPPRATTTPLKLRVTATNLGGVTSAPFIITFTALVAPAITSSSTWDLIVGQANSYQILTSVPATSYTLLGAMPSWVTSFNNRTGLITANPAASIANTVLQLTAGNAAGAGPVFNLTARTPVPIVSGPATVIAAPGITTTARMSASNSPTSWAKKSGPAWVTVSPQGLLSALPPSGGRFTAVVTASNAYGPSPDFTVTIDATTPPGSPVATFNTGAGANAPVFSVVPDLKNPNGLLYVAGNFTQYAGKPAVRLARVKADGSLDSTFNPGAGPNAVVRAVAVQPADERVLVGGEFTSFNGNFAGRLVRLSRTGAVDTSFVIGTGANAPIRAIVVQKDGKILLAGDFTLFNGQPAPYLARLNANGSMDTTFKPGIGPNGRVNALALASNGSIYIGGWFGGVGGKDASRIARLSVNGTFDPTFQTRGGVSNTAVSAAADPFTPGIGTTGTVNALAVTSSGRLLVGGDFNTAAGDVPSYRLAAFESTGLVVREFSFNGPASAPVDALVALSGGRVMAGGSFRFIGSPAQSRPGIAALSATGVVEADFRSPLNPAPRSALSSVALQPNGNILIGGSFISVQGATQTRVGMLYSENKTTLIARVGRPFRHAVSAASGARRTPPTFRVAKGSKLPPGLRLAASTGVITGTPTAAGIYNLTVQVSGGGSVQTSAFTVVVRK